MKIVLSHHSWRETVAFYFVIATLHSPFALAASEAFLIQEELSAIKSELLSFVEVDPDVQRYAYLDIDPDLELRVAELQTLGADGSAAARIRFSPTGANHSLIRTAFPAFVPNDGSCRFMIEALDGDKMRQYTLDCELHQLQANSMLELSFREGWFKPVLKIPRWDLGIDPKAENNRNRNQLSALLRQLVPSVTTHSFARTDEGRAAAPDVRYSVLLCKQDPWHGLNRLHRYKQRYGDAMPAAFWWAYADCALRAGVRGEAVVALQHLEANDATQLSVYDIRIQLSAYDYRWDYTAGAQAWVAAAPEEVPIQLRTRWRDIQSRLQLDQAQFGTAAEILSRGRHLQAAGSWLEPFYAAFLHYAMRMNYAYALMSSGHTDEALAVLDRVGSSPALDAQTRELRELANMKLGWHFLSQGYGATSGRVFHRISTQGQVAREALLGMGWAMLAPKGEAQQLIEPPGFSAVVSDPPATTLKSLYQTGAIGCAQYKAVTPDAVQACMPAGKFDQVAYSQDLDEQRQRALRFWSVLLEEEEGPGDSIFLEAHIAAANLFIQLGDQQRGQLLYQRAVETSEKELANLAQLRRILDDPQRLVALASEKWSVPADAEPSVFEWLTRADTQTLLGAIAATQQLSPQISAALATSIRRSAPGIDLAMLRGRTENAKQRAIHLLAESAKSMLDREQRQLERYRLQASLELSDMQGIASHGSN